MRSLFLCLVAALFAAPAAAADLPVAVLRIKPIGPLLEDLRAGARLVGGEEAVKKLNDTLKQGLGEKGFDGVDLTRPVLAYLPLKGKVEKAEETPFVMVVPVTGEKAFLEFLGRTGGKAEPVAGKAGLYRYTPPKKEDAEAKEGAVVQYLRFVGGLAYIAQADAATIDPANLVTVEQLAQPEETALFAARVYFDRLPEESRKQFTDAFDKAIADIKNTPVPPDAEEAVQKLTEKVQGEAVRLINLLRQGDQGVFRVVFDAPSGEVGLEFGLTGKPGSELAKVIADRKPTTNRFAGLVSKETAVGLTASAPLLTKELGDAFALGLESAVQKKPADVPPAAQPLVDEIVKGLARTFRAGSIDWAVALNGPDRNNLFTAVAAISFEDPAAVEKEVRKLVAEQAPPEAKELIKLDAAKVGAVSIHEVKAGAFLPPEAQQVVGESATVAVAFAPKGVYVAVGPDAVAALKVAVAAPGGAARALDLVVNPARVNKLAAAVGGEMAAAQAADVIGTADERVSAVFVDVAGGREIRLRIGLNLKLVGGAAFRATTIRQEGREPK